MQDFYCWNIKKNPHQSFGSIYQNVNIWIEMVMVLKRWFLKDDYSKPEMIIDQLYPKPAEIKLLLDILRSSWIHVKCYQYLCINCVTMKKIFRTPSYQKEVFGISFHLSTVGPAKQKKQLTSIPPLPDERCHERCVLHPLHPLHPLHSLHSLHPLHPVHCVYTLPQCCHDDADDGLTKIATFNCPMVNTRRTSC